MKHILKIDPSDLVFLNKTMSASEITKGLERFQGNVDSPTYATDHTARYIIATTSSFALGLTLAEAKYVALLEPDFQLSTVTQVFARHCRQGNKEKVVFAYLFRAKDSIVEERIQNVNNLRQLIDQATERKVADIAEDAPGTSGPFTADESLLPPEEDLYGAE